MKKLVGMLMLSTGLLAGCGEEKQDVVNLSYIDTHWTVSTYAHEQPKIIESVSETLQACTGDLTTELEGDLTVFDTVLANRHPMTDTGEEYAFKSVTYIKGDHDYALCRDMVSNRFQVEVIKSFPNFVDLSAGSVINRRPHVRPADVAAEATLRDAEELNEPENAVVPFFDTLVSISPAFDGEIELTVGDRPNQFPLFTFDPTMAHMEEAKVGIGYHPGEKKPYILMMVAELYVSISPLDLVLDPTEEVPQYHDLSVERHPLDAELVPDQPYPLYDFSYSRDGETVTETVTITYRASELLSTAERKALESNPEDQFMPIETKPLVYLHQQPFNTESTLSYPYLLRASGIEMDDLIQAIDDAEPTNRSGDAGEYPFLTIVEGLKGQEFDVTYKQRSKKLDIYVTDRSTDETYKLTSEGAETFLSYFPDLKKK